MILRSMLTIKFFIKLKVVQTCSSVRKYSSLPSNLRILFFGTDSFSLPSLKILKNYNPSRLEVVTSFKARNNPVKDYSEKDGIKVHDWMNFKNVPHIKDNFDIGLVVSFGHMIPSTIIDAFQLGMLNVHASLLPKYRGASPIIYVIKNGESETGVSIMRIKPNKFDVGEVLATRKMSIQPNMLMPELHDKLAKDGSQLLLEVLTNVQSFVPIVQDETLASYAPKIDNEICKVNWDKQRAHEIINLYRALYSFKNIMTSFKGETVKFIEIHLESTEQINTPLNDAPGSVRYCRLSKSLLIQCLGNKTIKVIKLSIGKKKTMSASDFNNGFLKKCSETERRFI